MSATDHKLVSTARLNEMKREMGAASGSLHALLGCEFGHGAIAHRADAVKEPCEEAAVQIVALHDGPREMHFKLCAHHRDLVLDESTPRPVG
jgi:hypothetical protein